MWLEINLTFNLVDGGWSNFGPWSECSHFCDIGTRYRQRTCSNPEPLYNGQNCSGDSEIVEECNTEPCLKSE